LQRYKKGFRGKRQSGFVRKGIKEKRWWGKDGKYKDKNHLKVH
jgi:hypothetical protein